MADIDLCGSCGVPRLISGVFKWEDGGTISISYSPGARMVFYESGNIDSIFRGVEELIGIPMEHIVMERKRRDTRRFIPHSPPLIASPRVISDLVSTRLHPAHCRAAGPR